MAFKSRKQRCVALSSTEAEFIALSEVVKEVKWWHTLLTEIGVTCPTPILVRCDNNGAVQLVKNPVHHERTKHVDIRYKFVRNEQGTLISAEHIDGTENVSDLFTKSVKADVLAHLRPRLLTKGESSLNTAVKKQ